MIAAVLELNRSDIKSLGIHDAYGLHKTVYSLFPKDEGKTRPFLYYETRGKGDKKRVMILSTKEPEQPSFGDLNLKHIPEDFLMKSTYGFRVRMNPVVRKTGNPKPVPIKGREELFQWFYRRAPDFGFEVLDKTLEVEDIGVQQIYKGNKLITHGKATFSGVLRVIDRERFVESFRNGIGRGKAFGFGLLQLQPLVIGDEK
jgi:CRISPR system Cascade subunit CasE